MIPNATPWSISLPVESKYLTQHSAQSCGTWKPHIVLRRSKISEESKSQDEQMAMRDRERRKKRMLYCNDIDTGLNVTWHESEPTSDWSSIAR